MAEEMAANVGWCRRMLVSVARGSRVLAGIAIGVILISGVAHAKDQEVAAAQYQRLAGEFVTVPGGSFSMGNGKDGDAQPVHTVHIKSFRMGKYEVTQAQWMAVMGNNPSYFHSLRRPVERVSWNDVQEFIRKLNSKTGGHFRLPTEAEWEYAARAGTDTDYGFGDDQKDLCLYENGGDKSVSICTWCNRDCDDGYGRTSSPVGSFKPNHYGLYDMLGNVAEWVEDCYHDSYIDAPDDGSAWRSGSCGQMVFRGGDWLSAPYDMRSASRHWTQPDTHHIAIGFRLVQDE